MRTIKTLLIAALLLVLQYRAISQIPGGQIPIFVAANETWTGQTFPAILKLPTDYATTTTKYPLIIFLHGTGEAGNINGTQLGNIYNSGSAGGPSYFIAHSGFPDSFAHPVTGQYYKFIVLSPQAPGWSTASNQLKFIINDMMTRYRIDSTRIYLTGLSAGGQGIMDYVTNNGTIPVYHAAAVVPMSAVIGSSQSTADFIVADSIHGWGFGSDPADSHGVQTHLEMDYMNLAKSGYGRFTNYPGGHCCWNNYYNPAYKETINGHSMNIYEWMLQYTRPALSTTANAGVDQVISLPTSSVTLNGSATPASGQSISTYAWTNVSGPAGFTITTPSAAGTTVTGLVQGTYIFRLTATDNIGGTASDDVQITVNAANIAPTANAGADKVIQLPTNTVTIIGSGTDADGTIAAYQWTKVSGPATFTIASPTAATTAINGLVQGVYVFRLTVTDNLGATGFDDVQVTVNAANAAPTANAGADQTIQLPVNTVTVTGSGADTDGTISTYAWTKVSGPATYSIASPAAASTAINGLVQGVYVFRLTVTDNQGATGFDDVQITVNAANIAPTANAGADQSIQLPASSVTVNGSGADADGTISTYAWTKVSGPATYSIASPAAASTAINGLVQGVYVFRLTVTDNQGATGFDDVQITVNAANIAPTANAGADQSIQLPASSVTVNGSGADADGTISTYAWTKVSGPATYTIASPAAASTAINGLVQGVYVFRLTVTDNQGATGFDDVQITVNAANIAPTANAGADQSIQLPASSVTVNGSGADADGTISTYAWTKVSGPATYTIASPAAASTAINGLVQGVYVFRLTVTDNQGATGFDDVQITVNAANVAPTANAGADQTIQLPVNTVTVNGSGADADGTIAAYAWINISGPAGFTITSPSTAATTITGLVQGTYIFRLTVTDNQGAIGFADVQITVNGTNVAPTANAGADQTFQLPTNSATINGSGTDADGTISTYAWTNISGPAGFTITSPSNAATTITGLVQGTYIFRLTVTDNQGATGSDDIQIIVSAANLAPTANAGADQAIQLPVNTVTVTGSGADADGTISTYAWTKVSGPATYTIVSAASSSTAINGLMQGVYVFRLTVTDNQGATGFDDVQITVNAANVAPTANAGADQTIQLPVNTVTVTGIGADADGTISTYAWTKVSGPATYTIASPAAASTAINGLVQGVYVFRLTVTDNQGATGSDDVQITVNASANIPPVANAGTDQTIQLPANSGTLNGSLSSDPDGSIVSYLWSKLSGPNTYDIISTTSVNTTVTGLVQGIYVFKLKVTDNQGATDSSNVTITVNAAASVCNGVRRVLFHETWGGFFNGNSYTYNPGDTLVIKSSDGWGALGLGLESFHGTATCPVVVINEGEPFTALGSILIRNCTYVKVTGSGSSAFYGFQSNNAFSAIDIDGRSANIEVERWKVTNAGYICRAKQDPSCADSLNYPNWRMDHISLHDTWSKGVNQDGIYFGNTAPTGGRPFYCNGVLVDPIPIRLSNVSIYNNYVDSTGRTGIQLSGCDSGYNEIYNNVVRRTGFELNQTQGSGIIIGGMAHAYVHNNVTRQTFQYGILSLGSGFSRIENNDIDSSGILNGTPNAGYDFSIAVNAITTLPLDSSMIWIKNNKLDNSDVSNIITGASVPTWVTSGNIICGNIKQNGTAASIYLNGPGFTYTADCSGTNQPPHSYAGVNQTITLPLNQVTVNGTGSFDPDGFVVSYAWTKVSGPNNPVISTPAAAITVITGLVQGVYVFKLTVTDNIGVTGESTVTITVNAPANQPPVANAGTDKTIQLPVNTVTLNGTGTDPDGTIAAYQWTKISGPATYTIVSPAAASTVINNLVQGVYQFELKVTDNLGATARDTVYVTVNPSNFPPVANAGPDKLITLPTNTVTLTGSGTDPDGTIAAYQWTKISGPATFTIVSPTQVQTVINNLVQGVYQFELTVTDNQGATGKDTVVVTVNPAPNQLPSANAGPDKTLTLPVNSVTLTGSGTDPDGTITAYQWTKISGPATYTIVSPAQAQTVINNLVQGVYQFELKVTDNSGATAKDTVAVTVNAAANQPPVANAGTDKTIQLPLSTVTLNGTGTDPDGTIAAYQWTKIAGPASYTIVSPTAASTVINSLVQGIYQFELMVTDNQGATGKDTVIVYVNAASNQPPVANAGADQAIQLPVNTVTVNGSGTDADGTITTYQWTKVSGPAAYTIVSAASASTAINGLVQGVYVFRLLVTDNQGSTGFDDVQITVNPANIAPTANAGADQTIQLPVNTVTVNGSGADADGTISTYAWTKVSGPATYTIVSPTAASTAINGLVQGVYVFRLTVTDNQGATGFDDVQITVNTANIAPTANAGADQTIQLPVNTITINGSGADADGTISTYAWTKVSGPATYTIVSPTAASTAINGLVQGVYVFRLIVTDNQGATGFDDVQITVNAAIPNQPPIANAGLDQNITLPISTVTLNGSGTDPDGTITAYLWTKIAGPNSFTIVSPTAAATVINNLVLGTYQFELKVTDNAGATAKDTVWVVVNPSAAGNLAPIVHAGNNKTLELPVDNTMLVGDAVDLDGTVTTYLWTKLYGPLTYTIVSPTQPHTEIRDLVVGHYGFELKATDNRGAISRDTVYVDVTEAPVNLIGNIYPNPATTQINVPIHAAVGTDKTIITIFDVKGMPVKREVFMRTSPNMVKQYNVAGWSRGFYMIEIQFSEVSKEVRKFILQ